MRKHKTMINKAQANEFLRDLKGTTKNTITGIPINAYNMAANENDLDWASYLMCMDICLFKQFFRACKEYGLI